MGSRLLGAAVTLAAALLIPRAAMAHCGGGPCACPDTIGVVLPPGQPSRVLVHANFGLVMSEDAGKSWAFVCEELFDGKLTNTWKLAADGRLVVATYGGLFSSSDAGCGWKKAGGDATDLAVNDAAFEPGSSTRVWLIGRGADGKPSLQLSTDGGAGFSFTKIFDEGFGPERVFVAPSDPKTIYVSGSAGGTMADPIHGVVFVTRDGGMSWNSTSYATGTLAGHLVTVLGVAPDDAKTVLLVRRGNGDIATREPAEIWRSIDEGKTPVKTLALAGTEDVAGFSLGSGQRVFVAGLARGDTTFRGSLYLSDDGGASFAAPKTGGPGYRCLGFRDGTLYACAGDRLSADGFALASSPDDGTTWKPMMGFDQIRGAIGCAKDRCTLTDTWLATTLLGFQCVADSGGADEAGERAPEATVEPPLPEPKGAKSGCGCRTPEDGATPPAGPIAAVGLALGWRLRRRRR